MKAILFVAIFALTIAEEQFKNVVVELETAPSRPNVNPKIVNGQTARENQFPHQALLFIILPEGKFKCGGSLISPEWVLSAAHCVIGARAVKLYFGAVNVALMTVLRNAVQINRLSTFDETTLKDDIALIKMNSPVTYSSSVQPINLPTQSEASKTYLKNILIASGFGLTAGNISSQTLQYTSVKGISNAECSSIYDALIPSTVLCTLGQPNTNQGTCSGDSGGPLIVPTRARTLVGIVSFGYSNNCAAGNPQGFTRVGHYLSWISSVTGIKIR